MPTGDARQAGRWKVSEVQGQLENGDRQNLRLVDSILERQNLSIELSKNAPFSMIPEWSVTDRTLREPVYPGHDTACG